MGDLVDWKDFIPHAATAVMSGAAAFGAAWGRFKSQLQGHSDEIKRLSGELPRFRETHELEEKHRRELDNVRENMRLSIPDPLEDIRADIARLEQEVAQVREKQSRYVRSDTFAQFTKAQEDQWKEMMRTLGRLEGALK